MTTPRRLKAIRERLGLSQRDLADELHTTSSAIAQWESGKHTMPGAVLRWIELMEEELRPSVSPSALQLTMQWWASRAPADEGNLLTRRLRQWALRSYHKRLADARGLAAKLGQTYGFADFLLDKTEAPSLVVESTKARRMSAAALTDVFVTDSGKTPRQLFKHFDAEPVHCASIGQVHRAVLADGTAVAVKVQYPRVKRQLQSELRVLDTIDDLVSLLFRAQRAGVLANELRQRLMDECDYVQEGNTQATFHSLFAGRPGLRIPAVMAVFTRPRILVSEWVDGQSFQRVVAQATSQRRSAIGATLAAFFFESMFVHGLLHADPHPDNFLFTEDEVVVLDFGRVKRFSNEFRTLYRELTRSVLERDRTTFEALVRESGTVADPHHFDFDYLFRALVYWYAPILVDGEFTCTTGYVKQCWSLFGPKNPNRFRTHYPADVLSQWTFQFGVGALHARLGARVNFRAILLPLLYAQERDWPRPFAKDDFALLGLALPEG